MQNQNIHNKLIAESNLIYKNTKLKAGWSIEAAQDMMAMHGIEMKIEDYIKFNKTPIPFSIDVSKVSGAPKCTGVIGVHSLVERGDLMALVDAQTPGGMPVFLVSTIRIYGGNIVTDGISYWVSNVAPIPEDGQEDIIKAVMEYADKMEVKSYRDILARNVAEEIMLEEDTKIMNAIAAAVKNL